MKRRGFIQALLAFFAALTVGSKRPQRLRVTTAAEATGLIRKGYRLRTITTAKNGI